MGRAHGVRGELRVVPQAGGVFPSGVVRVRLRRGNLEQVREVIRVRPVHEAWLVTFAGVDQREAAAALTGAELAVNAEDLAPLAAGEVYVHELEGATVVDEGERVWGTVERVWARPGQDVLVIAGSNGELLLPFVPETVVRFERERSRLVVRPTPGLWDADERT